MSIPRHFIDMLLTRIDLIELINQYVPLSKKSGSNYFACCPFHNEKSASFSVSATKQFYYCFGCSAHGNAIDFMMQFDHLSFPDAVESLAQQLGLEIPETDSSSHKRSDNLQDIFEMTAKAAQFYANQLRIEPRAIDYLKQRGISGAIAKQFCLGYAAKDWSKLLDGLGQSALDKKNLLEAGLIIKKSEGGYYDRFRDRILFPIHDYRGRVIGFGGRVIDQGEPKYLNSPETRVFQKGQELYGLYHTLKSNRQVKRIVIVEGYMDVIALFQNQIQYAVATLGTATTQAHLSKLCRYTAEIIFCFDGDNAGKKAAWRAVEHALQIIHDDLRVRFLFLPDGEDPDSLIRKEGKLLFEQRLANATPLSNFFFDHLLQDCDLNAVEGRSHFVSHALSFLKLLPPGLFQQFMLTELSKRARIDMQELTQRLIPKTKTEGPRVPLMIEKNVESKLPMPLKVVLALLVQYPHCANLITDPMTHLKFPGANFLAQLIEIIKKSPNITTGGLIELWRDQKEVTFIIKLASWSHQMPEEGIENEFLGAYRQLLTLGFDEEIDRLMAKAANNQLNEEEKITLSQWIGKKKALQALNR